MTRMKKVLSCVLSLMFALVFFVGCAQTPPAATTPAGTTPAATTPAATTPAKTTAAATTAKKNIKISMTWWGDTVRNEVYNKVIDLFVAANPNITVDRPFGAWATYFDVLSTQIAGGNAPDVIGMHQRFASEYALRGALLDLKTFVDSGVIKVADIPDSVLKAGYINSKMYMITQGVTGSGVAFNTSVFDKVGVSYPKMDWTWDEYALKLKEIKTAADAKGIKIIPSSDLAPDIYNFSYWVRANGQNLFKEDGKIGFTEDMAVSWFKFWKGLRDQGLIPDAATVTEFDGIALEQSMFATNKVAITGMAASQIGLYQPLVKDSGQINIVRFPNTGSKTNPEYLSGAFYTVNSKSKDPEAAALLINFFVNNPEGQKVFKIEQGVPPAKTAVAGISSMLTPSELKSVDYIQNQLVKYASPEPYPPVGYNEITAGYKTVAMNVAFGKQTPEVAATELMKLCQDILAKNK